MRPRRRQPPDHPLGTGEPRGRHLPGQDRGCARRRWHRCRRNRSARCCSTAPPPPMPSPNWKSTPTTSNARMAARWANLTPRRCSISPRAGCPPASARRLMLHAFIAEAFVGAPDEERPAGRSAGPTGSHFYECANARSQRDLRADFPGHADPRCGRPWHYLDSGATAQKPQAVIDAMAQAMGADYATVHRGVYARSAEMTMAYEAARRQRGAQASSAPPPTRSSSPAARPRRSTWSRKAGGRRISNPAIACCFRHWSIIRTSCRGNCCATGSASKSTSAR